MYSEMGFINFKQIRFQKRKPTTRKLRSSAPPPPKKKIYQYMFSFYVTQSKLIKIIESSPLIHKYVEMWN